MIISQHTYLLDWHMTKLLGKPSSIAVAQFCLMVPISVIVSNNGAWFLLFNIDSVPEVSHLLATLHPPPYLLLQSAFLNNTPLVIIMIPIFLNWGENNGISPVQLLVPLLFCTILGGTCTLIGTSTNLVVAGLYTDYPNKPPIGLFDLGQFGVPISFIGMSYIIAFSQYLLPGEETRRDAAEPIDNNGTILLAARLTK